MTAEQLRNSILQEAISGRLVPQDPNDEPASILLERLRKDFAELVKSKKIILSKPEKKAMMVAPKCDYDLPENWSWCTLCDISRVYGRIGFRGYTKLDLVNKKEDGAISLSPSNMKNGALDFSSCTYISNAKYEESPEIMVGNDDILIVKTGSSYGKVSHVTNLPWKSTINPQIAIIKEIRVNTKYLFYALQSPNARNKYEEFVLGTSIPTFSQENLLSMSVPLPPLAEQKRIVAKLEELLPIVEQYGKAQKELDELNAALPARLRQSILQEAISGKLVPQDENETADGLVKLILDRKKALLKSGELERRYVKELPIDDSEFEIELPKGWCLCKLGNIARISAGGTPARDVAAYWSNGKIPWLKISDITASDKYVNSASEYITEAGMNNSSAKLMKKGTLLYTIFASIGEVGILNFEATCNQAIANIDLYVPEMTNYIYYYLKNLQAYMYSISKGCAQLNINQDILKNAIVPLPPLAEQKRIVAKIEELFAEIDKLK